MLILYPKIPKDFTKSAIFTFALFCPIAVTKKHHALHFSLFSLEILNTTLLNLILQLTFKPDFKISTLALFWRNFSENFAKIAPKWGRSRNSKYGSKY